MVQIGKCFIIQANLKTMEDIIQNTGQIAELSNPDQNKNVHKETESTSILKLGK